MTPSIDPNFTSSVNRQLSDTYNWQTLINQSPSESEGQQSVNNPVQATIQFLNCFISHESVYGDSEGAREMMKVLLIMQSVDSPVSDGQARQTRNSYEYVCAYLDLLNETDASFEVCLNFERLQGVLEQLIQMRQQVAHGVLCSYGQLSQRLRFAS